MTQKTKRSIQWVIQNKTFFIPKKKKYAGIHLIVEFWNGKIIKSEKELEFLLTETAKIAKTTPLKSLIYKFEPQGITGVILLAESHISIHTWPEINYIAIDVFTCGKKDSLEEALNFLKKELKPERIEIKTLKRGKMII